MTKRRRSRFGDVTVPTDSTMSSEKRPEGVLQSLVKSLENLTLMPRSEAIARLPAHSDGAKHRRRLTKANADCSPQEDLMKSDRIDQLADLTYRPSSALRERGLSGVLRSIASSTEQLQADRTRPSILAFTDRGKPSVASQILEFATSGTKNCSGGRSCARLYLALQGMAVPVGDTATGMDLTRLEWWIQALAEHAADRWGGNERGVRKIAATQPLIWEQAQASTRAWEKAAREQDARFRGDEDAYQE